MLFFDTETKHTDNGKLQYHTMDMAYTYLLDYRRHKGIVESAFTYFDKSIDLCRYIDEHCYLGTVLTLVSHNAFFDIQNIGFFPYFTERNWEVDFYYDKGLTYILVLKQDNRTIKVLSSTNFYDFSLKQLGDMVGIKKTEVSFDTSTRAEIAEYCKNDVRILVTAMLDYFRFIDVHNCGNWAMTKSGQAYNAFRHAHMTHKIQVHNDETVIALERSAYFGGRTEAFKLGDIDGGPFVSLDINSMYPYVMRSYDFPTRLIDYNTVYGVSEIAERLDRFAMIADCDVETSEPVFAKVIDGKLCFPVGRFNARICSGALSYAIANNMIVRVNAVAVYDKAPVFRDFVDYFYPLKAEYKREGNKVFERLVKLMLNSLYGKFGQRRSVINQFTDFHGEDYYRMESYDMVTGERILESKFLNTVIQQYGMEETDKTVVAIPAHITEYARLLLWSIIKSVGYGRVLYCDTDSVKMRVSDLSRVTHAIDNGKLGALSNEGTFNRFSIYGPKDYVQDDYVKMKGIPKSAEHVVGTTYRYATFYRQAYHLWAKIPDRYVIGTTEKTLKREYTKGVVHSDCSVSPFVLSDF